MPQAPRRTAPLQHNAMPFLLKRRHTLDRKHQSLFSEKERVGTNCSGDSLDLARLFQFNIDIPLAPAIRRSLFRAEGVFHAHHLTSHCRMMKTRGHPMPGLGLTFRSQQSKERTEKRQGSRIPPGTHNGRDVEARGQPMNGLPMSLKRLPVQLGCFDDRHAMLETIVRCLENLCHRHAQKYPIHLLNLRRMRDDRNLAECIG